uniref:C2H2-type domain-containing protein n=1 Tax=Graphocephala atropunctata TaxID=36148 RepID=A0A1B6LWK2_9HEMI
MSSEQTATTYIRRRAYNKVHVRSWLIYLEKDGFVRCSFKNCDFMAFDVEEMCKHYGFCKGESSFAKYMCPVCEGRTNSEANLQFHLAKAHNIATPDPARESPELEAKGESNNKPSRVLVASWGYFFETNNYVKCSCGYLANTLLDMHRHYSVCKQEFDELFYVCPECKGRTANVTPLLWHMERSHKIYKSPKQFNAITRIMVDHWQQEIEQLGQASCLHTRSGKRDCLYFDMDLLGIIEHSQSCKGPQYLSVKVQCPNCPKWTNTLDKLSLHSRLIHEVPNNKRSRSSSPESSRHGDTECFEEISICELNEESTLTKEENSGWLIAIDNQNSRIDDDVSLSTQTRQSVITQKQNSDDREETLPKNHNYEMSIEKHHPQEETVQEKNGCSVVEAIRVEFSQEEEEDEVMVIDLESDSGDCRESQVNSDVDVNSTVSEDSTHEKSQLQENSGCTPGCSDDVIVEVSSEQSPRESQNSEIVGSLEGNDKNDLVKEIVVVAQEVENMKDKVLVSQAKEVISVSKKTTEKVKPLEGVASAFHFNLFRDSASSDEEDVNAIKVKSKTDDRKDEDVEPTSSCKQIEDDSKKKSIRHYSKRPRHNSESSSQVKHMNTSAIQDVYLESKYYLEDPGPTSTVSFVINKDGKIHWDAQDNSAKGSIRPVQQAYTKPAPKVCTNQIKNNSEDISKSSEKNDKLMRVVATPDSSGGQSRAKVRLTDRGLRENSQFKSGSIEVVGVEYNVVKTKDGSAVVENNCDMILHIDEGSLSDDNSVESHFIVAVGTAASSNLKSERGGLATYSKSTQQPVVMLEGLKSNKIKKSDVSDNITKSFLDNSNSEALTLPIDSVMNVTDNEDQLRTSPKYENSSDEHVAETMECLKPSIYEDVRSNIICDTENTSLIEPNIESEILSKIENVEVSLINLDKSKDCSNINNSTDYNNVQNAVILDSADHSKSVNENISSLHNKCHENVKSISDTRSNNTNNGLITVVHSLDHKDESKVDKVQARVSFLYKGKLSNRSSESNVSLKEESTENSSECDIDKEIKTNPSSDLKETLQKLQQKEGTDGSKLRKNIISSNNNKNIRRFDHLPVKNIKVEKNKVQNSGIVSDEKSGQDTSDVSRRSSSELFDDGYQDDEDFMDTDEEYDMKDQSFIGFNEISEKLQTRRRSFHQFVNRLSESENEEWYINAGNLSMNYQKVENVTSDKLLSDQNLHLHHDEVTDTSTENLASQKGKRENGKGLPNHCIKDVYQNNEPFVHKSHRHLNSKPFTNVSSSESLDCSIKITPQSVISGIVVTCKEKERKRDKEAIEIECHIEAETINEIGNNQYQLYSEINDHIILTEETTSPEAMDCEVIESKLQEEKFPRNCKSVGIIVSYSNTDRTRTQKEIKSLSTVNGMSETSNLDHSELTNSSLTYDINSSGPCCVTTEIPRKVDKNDTSIVLKYQSDVFGNEVNKDRQNGNSSVNNKDILSTPTLDHKIQDKNSSYKGNVAANGNTFVIKSEKDDAPTRRPDAIDEKLQQQVPRKTLSSQKMKCSSSNNLNLIRENMAKSGKAGTKFEQKSQVLFIDENAINFNKKTSDKSVKTIEGAKENVFTSTPKRKGRNPKIDFVEDYSVLENSESICENVSCEENTSLFLDDSKTEPNTKCNQEKSSIDKNTEELVTINLTNTEDIVHELPTKRIENPKLKTDKEESSFSGTYSDSISIMVTNEGTNPVLHKKRGRKPKLMCNEGEISVPEIINDSACKNAMNEEVKSSLPKKRGRKPKPKCNNETSSVLETSISINEINEEENYVPPPKRRGRKPKTKYIEENSSVEDKESTSKKLHQDENRVEVNKSVMGTKPNVLFSNEASEVSNLTFLPKRRGRPPKNKSCNIEVLKQEKNCLAEHSKREISILGEENPKEMLFSIYSDEADILLRGGVLHGICSSEITTFKGSIQCNISTSANTLLNGALLQNNIKKKRGRPPKSQSNKSNIVVASNSDMENDNTSSSNNTKGLNERDFKLPVRGRKPKTTSRNSSITLSHNDWNNSNVINEIPVRKNDVLLPKKRGRPPKKRLVSCDTTVSEEDQLEALPLSDRVGVSRLGGIVQQEKRKRRPKSIFDNSKTDTSCGETDENQHNSLTELYGDDYEFDETMNMTSPPLKKKKRMPELLDTDVIFINTEKLSDSLHSSFNKRKGKSSRRFQDAEKKSTTNVSGILDSTLDMSDSCKSEIKCENEDSDSDRTERIENEPDGKDIGDRRKRKKRTRKVFFEYIEQEDGGDDNSDGEETKEKSAIIRRPQEEVIFTAKHKNNDMVVCGVCKKEMSYKIYKTQHSIFTHYALCWLDGEEKPVDMTDDKEVVNRLWYSKKKLGKTPFKCFNCNLPKLSAVGFQSHIRFCGKEHEMESLLSTCPECGATMKPSSLRPHLYMKHSSKTKASSIDTSSIIPKARRAAASKADEVLQSSRDDHEVEGQAEGQSQWRPTSPQLRQMQHLYTKPNKLIPKEEVERWKSALKEKNVVTCRHPNCKFSATTTITFRKHYFSCPFFPPRLVYRCRQCEFVSEEETAIQEHLAQEHADQLQSSSGSESGSESDEGSDVEHNKHHHHRYNLSLPFKFLRSLRYRSRSFPKKFFFNDALMWTYKMRLENLTDDMLFPEAVEPAKALRADQASRHLPTTASSIRFRGSDGSWHSLPRFQGSLVDGVPVMFAGGPVWACAWASVPDTEDRQYLAVASHPNMDMTHEMAAVYSYPSILQVWAVGRLINCLPRPESEDLPVPKFLMGIAHSRGAVWSLQWCPSGCYDDTRLGLLAAACSDGSVALYSIPHNQPTSEHTIYEMEPVMELKLGCEMMSQCKCIDWHGVAPHSTIVGGFANGMVALWDLQTTSPLLREGNVIYPFKVFEAHLSAVTAVSLSPTPDTTGTHLMTASLDRATKFWRLDDTTAPINAFRKASVTDAVMPGTWMTSINAYDDVYSTNSTHIMGYSYRETFNSTNTNFHPQTGTVWGVSFNEWINSIACASEVGELTVLFRRQLLVTEDSKKVKSNSMRQDLISCTVQHLGDSSATQEIGHRYQDCADNVGLNISFKEKTAEAKKPGKTCSVDTMENYPILSINKVTWNHNFNSFTWLAAGLQCGLVMAPHISCLQSKDLVDLHHRIDSR